MAVSQVAPQAFRVAAEPVASPTARETFTQARLAGSSLLVAIASIIVVQAGGSIVGQGTRPEDAQGIAPIAAYFGHGGLAAVFTIGLVTVIAMSSFALAIRRYLSAFRPSPSVSHVIDLGAVSLVLVVGVYAVVIGLGLALIRLVQQADPAAVGVFAAFTWIYDGTLNWIEGVAIGLVSVGALLSRGWPRWLAGFGIIVSVLLLILAAPAELLGYPDGFAFGAYVPGALWMVTTGVYLVRGGRNPESAS